MSQSSSDDPDETKKQRTTLGDVGPRIGYCVMILGSIVLILNTLSYSANNGAYPHIVLGLIAVLAAVGLYRSFSRGGQAVASAGPAVASMEAAVNGGPARPGRRTAAALRTVAYIVLTIIYALAWNWVGTLLSTFAFLVVVLLLLGERNIWLLAGVPVCLTALIYYIFQVVLYLPFPRGPLSP